MDLETGFKTDRLDKVLDKAKELGELVMMEKRDGGVIGIIEIKYYDPEKWGKKTLNDSRNEASKRIKSRHTGFKE